MEQLNSTETTAVAKPKRFNWTSVAAVFALLISLIVAAELGLYYRDTHKIFAQANQNITILHTQLQQLQGIQTTLQNQLLQQQKQFTKLQQLNSGNRKAWVLAEVKYMVRLASYNLSFSHDIGTSISLLQTADQRIATLNNPSLNALRQQLADAITALQAVPKVDLAGVLAKLTALQAQAKQLPLISPPSFKEPVAAQTSDLTGWRKYLRKSLDTLKSMVIIRHHNQPIEPLIGAEQQQYLQQNLQLILQQAQWAALHSQAAIYRNSLQQAADWAEQYFAPNDSVTQAFVQNIKDLQNVTIQPKLPNMDKLIDAVLDADESADAKEE